MLVFSDIGNWLLIDLYLEYLFMIRNKSHPILKNSLNVLNLLPGTSAQETRGYSIKNLSLHRKIISISKIHRDKNFSLKIFLISRG